MMKFRILFAAAMMVASSGAVVTGLVGTTGIASAHPSNGWPMPYTCSGGDYQTGTFVPIPSGIYANITVRGACAPAPNAVINVIGSVNVGPGAVLDAQSAPSTITVGRDVLAAPGSLLGLGCLPNPVGHMTGHPCTVDPTESSNITVNGNVIAWGANTVLLNGITVRANVALIGGGQQAGNPWPIKTNTIGGNLLVSGVTPEWLGVVVNNVRGNVILTNITAAAGETMEVGGNTIGWNLACWGLAPAVSGGVVPGEFNTVGGQALGQCANLQPSAS